MRSAVKFPVMARSTIYRGAGLFRAAPSSAVAGVVLAADAKVRFRRKAVGAGRFRGGPLTDLTLDAQHVSEAVASCPQADLHGGIVDRPRVKRKLLRFLFNHLVGALQQRLRHGEAECLRCLQVDD